MKRAFQPKIVAGGLPEAPKDLSADSKERWRAFNERWRFNPDELMLLETALRTWDEIRTLERRIRRHGATQENRYGMAVLRPEVQALRDARKTLRELFEKLKLELPKVVSYGPLPADHGGK